MKSSTVLAASLLAAAAIAQPHQHAKLHKKQNDDVVWVTDWDYVTQTVGLTTTLWVSEGFVPPTSASAHPEVHTTHSPVHSPVHPPFHTPSSSGGAGQFFQSSSSSSSSSPAPSPSPSTSTSTSSYVAPAPPTTLTTSTTPTQPAYTPPSSSSSSSTPVYTPSTSSTWSSSSTPATTSVYTPPPPPPPPATTSSATPTSSSPAPASTSSSSGSSGSSSGGQCTVGSPCSGDITYYQTALGACGWTNDGTTEKVVALPHALMGSQSNGNPFCGKTITINANGKSTTAKVVDKCMGCEGFSIDLSEAAFTELDSESVGRTGATWFFN